MSTNFSFVFNYTLVLDDDKIVGNISSDEDRQPIEQASANRSRQLKKLKLFLIVDVNSTLNYKFQICLENETFSPVTASLKKLGRPGSTRHRHAMRDVVPMSHDDMHVVTISSSLKIWKPMAKLFLKYFKSIASPIYLKNIIIYKEIEIHPSDDIVTTSLRHRQCR